MSICVPLSMLSHSRLNKITRHTSKLRSTANEKRIWRFFKQICNSIEFRGKKTKMRRLHYWSASRWEKKTAFHISFVCIFERMNVAKVKISFSTSICIISIFFHRMMPPHFFSFLFSSHAMHFMYIFIVVVTKNEAFYFFIRFVFFLYIWMSIPLKMFYILNLSRFIFFSLSFSFVPFRSGFKRAIFIHSLRSKSEQSLWIEARQNQVKDVMLYLMSSEFLSLISL